MTKDEALKLALRAYEKNERHLTVAETRHWCTQYKLLAQQAIAALAQPAVTESHKQEPVAWDGGEAWESLAWELCADENGEDSCNELIWEGGPIPEPWGDRWMKYEHEAKRLIAIVQKHTTPPQRTAAEGEDTRSSSATPCRAWVGLTWHDVPDESVGKVAFMEGAKWADKQLKGKNT